MKYDINDIENKLMTMSNSEKENYLNNLIFETEKRLIEVQSNSFDHLKDRTQNDYNKYLTALEEDDLIYWYDDKVEINGKKLNDTIAQKKGIENHKLLRRRLKIENEVKSLNDRISLFRKIIEREPYAKKRNNQPAKFKSNYSDESLTKIMQLLVSKKQLAETDLDLWLYWFNRSTKYETPIQMDWIGTPTMAANVFSTICGNYQTVAAKAAFKDIKITNVSIRKDKPNTLLKRINGIIVMDKQNK